MKRIARVAMALVLAVAWALPLAWWSLAAALAVITAILAAVVWSARSAARARPTLNAVVCLWTIGVVAAAYAAGALAQPSGDTLTRLGYPFLVQTALGLPGGACLLLLLGVVAVTPSAVGATR